MVYSARSFLVKVEPTDDDVEYETENLERIFVTDGDMPKAYSIAVDYFSQDTGAFRIVSIEDMGLVLVNRGS